METLHSRAANAICSRLGIVFNQYPLEFRAVSRENIIVSTNGGNLCKISGELAEKFFIAYETKVKQYENHATLLSV